MNKNDRPLISVIVPAYNARRFLQSCCMSVVGQTYENKELIVVNDGSTDGSEILLREIEATNDVTRVITVENGGVSRARNIGIEAANGEYIAFLDADDRLMPDALEMMYKKISDNNCDIAICQRTRVRPDGVRINMSYFDDGEDRVWKGTEALERSLEDHPAGYSVWARLYKKSFVGSTRFREGIRIHEDSLFLFELFLKQPGVVVSDESVYLYMISDDSASRSVFSDKFFDILTVARIKEKLVEEQYPELSEKLDNMRVKSRMALLGVLSKAYGRNIRSAEKECIRTVHKSKNSFMAASEHDKRWFFIITHHLYTPYKAAAYVKNKLLKRQ